MKNSNIGKVGAGILSGLEELEDMTTGVKEQESKRVNEEKPNKIKVEKIKRSFMLTEAQIKMLYTIKINNPKLDLSEIVGAAIEKTYESMKADS